METDLIKYFLPSQLVEHFDVERVEECPIPGSRLLELHIHLSDKNQWLHLCVAFERYPELRRAYHHANRLRSSLARTHENRRRSHWMNGFGRPEPMAMPHSRAPQTVSVGTGKAS